MLNDVPTSICMQRLFYLKQDQTKYKVSMEFCVNLKLHFLDLICLILCKIEQELRSTFLNNTSNMFSLTVKLRSTIPTTSSLLVGENDPEISKHADGHPIYNVSGSFIFML